MEALGCFLDPGGCFNQGIASIIAWFPFGLEGIKAAVWMIVGAALGRFGVAAVIALALALKFAPKPDDPHEQVSGKDAAPPVTKPKKRKTLF